MKRCTRCRVSRPLEDFHRRAASRDGHQNVCKPCKQEYNQTYYRATADQYAEARRTQVDALRVAVNDVILQAKDVPCTDCGRRLPPDAMDLDHVRGRKRTTASGMRRLGLSGVLAELAKCDVVCVICHRRRTRHRRLRAARLSVAGWW